MKLQVRLLKESLISSWLKQSMSKLSGSSSPRVPKEIFTRCYSSKPVSEFDLQLHCLGGGFFMWLPERKRINPPVS